MLTHYCQFISLKDHLLKTRCGDMLRVASDLGGMGVSEGLGPGNGRAARGVQGRCMCIAY